jgi:hypothetical protein
MKKTTITKGTSLTIQSTVYTDNLVTKANLTGATVTALFKKRFDDTDANALLTKSVGTGVTLSDPTVGRCDVALLASETNDLSYGSIFFEILVKLASGQYIRSGIEEIVLEQNVVKTLN